MLYLFRKIRKSIINGGQASKYLLYAIGEVFLVVVGILIALQINNWNEAIKTKVTTNEYLYNLKNDLIADTLNIKNIVNYGERMKLKVDNYYNFFEQNNWDLIELIDSCESVPMDFIRYLPNNSTFTDMLSGGNTTLLDEEVRSGLSDLKILQDHLTIITNRIIIVSQQHFFEIQKIKGYRFSPKRLQIFEEITGKPSKKENAQLLRHYHTMYDQNITALGVMKGRGRGIKRKSIEIIKLIDQRLQK